MRISLGNAKNKIFVDNSNFGLNVALAKRAINYG